MACDSTYLGKSLRFLPDRIVVEDSGAQVMMAWERPLMRRMAEIATAWGGDVLEVGFGMGIGSGEVQARKPKSHTILEAHPQIVVKARAWAALQANVRIVAGRWQDTWADVGMFDGISFDVFAGGDQRADFLRKLPQLLRPRGVATLWLGDDRDLCPKLQSILTSQGMGYRLVRVGAVPTPDCSYSATNEFYLPIISRQLAAVRN